MSTNLKRIAVLTSGGDAPGMNAAVRSIVRTGLYNNIEMFGVYGGYTGLYENNIQPMNHKSVADIIHKGGTILYSSRFPEFKDHEIRAKCVENLKKLSIDALVVIGGDGSYMGAKLLTEEFNFPCIGLPGTIDNDVAGTDYTIGYQTALNTAVDAISKLRDTSSSHKRVSLVEIMGRDCGDLTIASSIAGGCEFAVVPELPFDKDKLIARIKRSFEVGKHHAIITITEHVVKDIHALANEIYERTGFDTRGTVLGHVQRGGTPCATDILLASRMGVYAVELLLAGVKGHCIGIEKDILVHHDILDSIKNFKRKSRDDMYHVEEVLF